MSSLTVEEDQKWAPTHVQVTVLRGRGLRGKGKHGTSDVYTIIQLGKEKYSTCVVEKTTEPEWREECSFELQPGVLDGGGRSDGANELVLTVMHRALIGLDVFLGQAVVHLSQVYRESRHVKNEWYRLNSKTGKKEKERGDIQLTVLFTRNNLTASMYDLVMKDKSASTFGKLKERMRGKRRSSEEDSSSAVLPGGYGTLCRMRQRLPSDGGGEEDYEDDEGGEARRSKMRTFFLRGKLRKSSDTRSSTSLGSESSESSSRGGSLSPTAGISVVVSDLSNSPSNSSNLTVDNSPEHTANTSPKSSSSLKCEFGDDPGEITIAVPVRVNGSHAYEVQPLDPGSGNPAGSLGLGLLQKSLPLSMSLQNLSPRASTDLPKGPVGDGRRWSFDKPGEEEKAAIAAALEQSGPMLAEEDEQLGQAAPRVEMESQGRKQRRNLFSHGRSESAGKVQSQAKDESEQTATEEKPRGGWFGSKEAHSKPSLVVSPKLEPSTDPHPPPPPPPSHHPSGPPVDAPSSTSSLVSPLHHTNPFSHAQSTPPPVSRCNPFFSLLQHNPFYEDLLQPSLPPLPFLSSSRPPIAQLFPQASNPNPTLTDSNPPTEDSVTKVERQPLPPTPSTSSPSNPFLSSVDSEWDESFEAFAAGRLQPPEGPDRSAERPRERCSDKGDDPADTNMHHSDMFAQFLETIPENESDSITLNTRTNSQHPAALTESNKANATTNTNDLTDANMHRAAVKLASSSPDPPSSGLGSSAEDDFLSCLSSYSDKFSASSSEETEAQNFESIVVFSSEKTTVEEKPPETEDELTDWSNHQNTVVTEKVSDGSASWSSVLTHAGEDHSTGVTTCTTLDDELCSMPPSLHIITSSPDVRQRSADSPIESPGSGGQGVSLRSPVPFGLLCDLSPSPGFDDTLLHTLVSDQSSSSFLQSLYVSVDSQDYQTCESQRPSSGSEPNETLHSANTTLCGETAADTTNECRPCSEDLNQTDPSEGSLCLTGDAFGSPSADSEQQHVVFADVCLKGVTRHRSYSEGTPTAFSELLLPSFGSDPGAIQESSSAPPVPDLPSSLTSFAPSVTPDIVSSSVALCSLPPLADATASFPPGTPRAAAPKPMPQETQLQAANQQNSPHPVKPLTTAMLAEEKRTEGRSVLATGLEKLKSTIHPGRSSQLSEQETERKKSLTEGAGSYYHLNHSELVALLVQREAELERQRAEFEHQKFLLAKREVELKKLKPQVRDLEDYIDTLLVRIMEQKPTLLQVRSKLK
ncbi:rab11 family-interacting protein 1 isoform X2 [Larimichthys crocea]|nr:rab11 family-interacting protein 1-like isoform X2 [Larimichthys crocea]